MYAATDTTARPPRPYPYRFLIGSWSFRHPSLSIAIRLTSATWNLALGGFMLSSGYLLGLVPLAGSALLLWAVCIVARDQSGSRRNAHS